MKDKKKLTIGIDVKQPKKACEDKKCPFHGSLKVHGKIFVATVIKAKFPKSPLVEWVGRRYIQKYERYEKNRTRVHVHNPPCINAVVGDKVRIAECKPLSKTKNFVIVEKLGEDIEFQLKAEGIEESKVKQKKEEKDEKDVKEKNEEKDKKEADPSNPPKPSEPSEPSEPSKPSKPTKGDNNASN